MNSRVESTQAQQEQNDGTGAVTTCACVCVCVLGRREGDLWPCCVCMRGSVGRVYRH